MLGLKWSHQCTQFQHMFTITDGCMLCGKTNSVNISRFSHANLYFGGKTSSLCSNRPFLCSISFPLFNFSAKRIEYWLPVWYAWVQYTPGESIHIFSIGPMKGSALTNGFCFSFHVLIGFSRTGFSLVYEDVFGFV